MSVPTAERRPSQPGASFGAGPRSWRPWLGGGRLLIALTVLAVMIGFLSLLIPSTPSYDPWAWLVWGHEIIHLNLHTAGGPSWKPLPMIFTTVFALFGRAQPDLWLAVARAGALMSVAISFKLAWRLTRSLASDRGTRALLWIAPLLAGAIAAGSLINSRGFISNNALGYSEGMATALMLLAVDRALDGKPRQAFAIGFFIALDRPETWLLWGPYGLYLFWRDRGARRLVVALFALIPVLWFLPELWGSGQLLRGVTRAHNPRSNSAAFTQCPICTVFRKEAWITVLNRVKVPGIIGLLAAAFGLWRTRRLWWRGYDVAGAIKARGWLLALGLFGLVWWLGVAVETQGGFSGNSRYLQFGTAAVAIAGGIAWGWFAQTVAQLLRKTAGAVGMLRRLAAAVALPAGAVVSVAVFLAVPPWIGKNLISIPRSHGSLVYLAHLRADLNTLVAGYGGAHRLLACGTVMTEGFQVPMVAWTLGVRTTQILTPPESLLAGKPWPAVILQARDTRGAHLLPEPNTILHWEALGAPYRLVHQRTFRLFSACHK